MRKREQEAMEKRKQILSSRAFEAWWTQRRTVYPVPKNPYQAYMTDLALQARLRGEKPWKMQPHRFDIEAVDFPIAPARRRPRVPPRLLEQLERMRKAVKPSPVAIALQTKTEEWAKKMGVPMPQIVEHPKMPALKSGYLSMYVPFTHQFVGGEIHIGTVGSIVGTDKVKIPEQVLGAYAHEFGHHVHATSEVLKTGKIAEDFPSKLFTKEETLAKEVKAWQLAEQIRKTSPQSWIRRYALGTYRGEKIPISGAGKQIYAERRPYGF